MENQTKLTLWFDDDLDGTGELYVEAAANEFSGKGSAYFSKSQIENFANALTAYPLEKENLPEIIGGRGGQIHLFMKAYPINGRGDLAIQVKLATELWDGDRTDSQHTVQLEIPTHYQPLADFAKEIKDLLNGMIKQASLKSI